MDEIDDSLLVKHTYCLREEDITHQKGPHKNIWEYSESSGVVGSRIYSKKRLHLEDVIDLIE